LEDKPAHSTFQGPIEASERQAKPRAVRATSGVCLVAWRLLCWVLRLAIGNHEQPVVIILNPPVALFRPHFEKKGKT
jgi:hypothetical protein